MTEIQLIIIYCFCDDFLISRGYQDWPNVKMSLAEIRLVYIVTTKFFYDNIESAYKTLKDGKYIQRPVAKGQLNQRLHTVDQKFWHGLIKFAYEKAQNLDLSRDFIIDSFLVSVCRNIRISRCRIYT